MENYPAGASYVLRIFFVADELMDLDWHKASTIERVILFRAVRNHMFSARMQWPDIVHAVFGSEHGFGQGWERNFAAGTIGRPVAENIYRWLVEVSPRLAGTVRQNILSLREGPLSLAPWETFLAERGNFGSLEVDTNPRYRACSGPPEPPTRQQQAQVQVWKPSDTAPRVAAGVPFCLNHRASIAGAAFAFQEVSGRWLPLPVDVNDKMAVVWKGRASFPLSSGVLVDDKLYVEYEQGRRRFVIVIAPLTVADQHCVVPGDGVSLTAEYLNNLAEVLKQIPDEQVRIELLNVVFVG